MQHEKKQAPVLGVPTAMEWEIRKKAKLTRIRKRQQLIAFCQAFALRREDNSFDTRATYEALFVVVYSSSCSALLEMNTTRQEEFKKQHKNRSK